MIFRHVRIARLYRLESLASPTLCDVKKKKKKKNTAARQQQATCDIQDKSNVYTFPTNYTRRIPLVHYHSSVC